MMLTLIIMTTGVIVMLTVRTEDRAETTNHDNCNENNIDSDTHNDNTNNHAGSRDNDNKNNNYHTQQDKSFDPLDPSCN